MRRFAGVMALIVMSIFLPATSSAFFMSSYDLKEGWDAFKKEPKTQHEAFLSTQFVGYVYGVVDSFKYNLLDIPEGVQAKQVIQIVGDYIEQNPQMVVRDSFGANLVLSAVQKVWPRNKKFWPENR